METTHRRTTGDSTSCPRIGEGGHFIKGLMKTKQMFLKCVDTQRSYIVEGKEIERYLHFIKEASDL